MKPHVLFDDPRPDVLAGGVLLQVVVRVERAGWEQQHLAISMRTAAYVHALNRLGEAINAKGTKDYYTSN